MGVYRSLGGSPSTNDHRYVRTRHPVRSAIYKHVIAGLVLRWVTTWESPVLFVLLPRSLDGRVAPEAWPRRFAPGGAHARASARKILGRWVV